MFNFSSQFFTKFFAEALQNAETSVILKKIIALFIRPVPAKPYTPPAPVRCYQPELPFK